MKPFQKFPVFLNLCLFLLLTATNIFAQATGGRASGTVTDTTNAAIPNATVTLVNDATGQTLTAQTTSAGAFNFPNLPVGSYMMKITADGFKASKSEVLVVLNQESAISVSLQPGNVTDQVDITAASDPQIQTDNSQLANTYNSRQSLELPIFNNPYSLSLLSPNVVGTATGVVGAGGTIGGMRPRGNSFNIDGVNNDDPSVTGPSTKLILDAIQEFTVLANNFNAEFGSTAGGQFNTITMSGTNTPHGSLFSYMQNEGLNARNSAATRPYFRNHRFGGTLGFPVIKDKLFFFGAYQYDRVKQSAVTSTYLAPTQAGLQQISTLSGVSPYVMNALQENLALAPVASTTRTVLGTAGIPFGNVSLSVPSGSREHLMQTNIDHLPNDKNQFRYRFSFERRRAEQPGGGNAKFNNLQAYDSRLFSATWVRVFSPTVVNDARIAYRRIGENYPIKNTGVSNVPNLIVTDLNLNFGPNPVLPQGAPANSSYQLADALSWMKGKHTFKFGADLKRQIYTQRFLQFARGYYDYTSFDQLLLDQSPNSNSSFRSTGSDGFTGNQFKYGFFGQDDWKVTPNLTFNLGVRYEYSTLPRDLAVQELNAIASVPGVIEFRKPRTDKNNWAPRVGFAYSPEFNSRVGKWLTGGRGQSAIRANFGMSYYENFYNLVLTSLPPQFQQTLTPALANSVFGLDPLRPFLQSGGIPNQLMPLTDAASARSLTNAFIPDQVSPLAMSWSLSYQRELAPKMVMEIRYLGTRGRSLPVQTRLNAPAVVNSAMVIPTFLTTPDVSQLAGLPTLGDVRATPGVNARPLAANGFSTNLTSYQFAGSSQYDAASISVTRQFTQGLAFNWAYTWSTTIDDSTVELNSSAINPRRPQDFFNLRADRARSALDIPHRLAMSFNYDLAYFEAADNKVVRQAFGGWQLHGIFQAQSGQPITVLSNVDTNFNRDSAGDRTIFNPAGLSGSSIGVTPINALGQAVAMGNNATVAYVANNPNAQYIVAGLGARATAGRNTLRTNGYNRTDLNLTKLFRFGERGQHFRIGAEFFDVFNQQPRTVAGIGALTTAFATAGNTFFNNYNFGTYTGRQIQLRAKLVF
ncbi:MAG: TonB-dependent receptor [Acidobacteria bacterium]|nr:TonB-dependent receptor [Acidobacteriota bacterium]